MKAIILAAGLSTRLRPITESKPKCMVNVAGKPILQHQIDAYLAAGVDEVMRSILFLPERGAGARIKGIIATDFSLSTIF